MNKPLFQHHKGSGDILVRIVAVSSTGFIRSLREQQEEAPEEPLVLHKLYTSQGL
jgi:hypothetical protein